MGYQHGVPFNNNPWIEGIFIRGTASSNGLKFILMVRSKA